jgi:hypothetical protein
MILKLRAIETLRRSYPPHTQFSPKMVSSIGLRGEDTRPFLAEKRFRPVDKIKNIFFIFFSDFKRAKLNKKKFKKNIFSMKFFGKKS